MSCELINGDKGTTRAVIVLHRCEIVEDVRNLCWIEGDGVADDDGGHRRHRVQDVAEERNVERVTRIIDLTVAQCRELLRKYTRRGVSDGVVDNVLRERKVYGIVMDVPEEFRESSLVLIERQIHEYVVCSVMAEWLSLTYENKAVVWENKANDVAEKLRRAVYGCGGRARRSLHPRW